MDARALADAVAGRLEPLRAELRTQFAQVGRIRSFVVDDLLPEEVARRIHDAFPPSSQMMLKKSLRENKYVAAQMDRYAPILEQAVYAFQAPAVTAILREIMGIPELLPDERLYAGGISAMEQGQFLNPHLDNSHDNDRKLYRVLNLLFYVTPGWSLEHGGNLELWDDGLDAPPRVIVSRFNRLVGMITDRTSLHSVQPVRFAGRRCCVSNYYFSPQPASGPAYFHATSFYGRPEQKIRDLLLRGDNVLRTAVLKFLPGVYRNPHIYRKPPRDA